jgi:hypothetical protein
MMAFDDLATDLAAVMDRISEADPAVLADGESIVALRRVLEAWRRR